MSTGTNSIVTPEAVAVHVDIAELGSRVGAAAIDVAILGAWLIVVGILASLAASIGLFSIGGGVAGAIFTGFILLMVWGYFPFFEEVWNGRTPGKRAFGLRVVQADGQPVRLGPVLVRNLIRIVDLGAVMIGVFLIFFTRRHQRIGDFFAGTIVIRDPKVVPPSPATLTIPPGTELPPLDTTSVSEAEYGLIRSFLERRWQLDPGARIALGNQLGNLVWSKVPGATAYVWGPEILLEAVLIEVQRRSGLLSPPAQGGWA